MAPAGGAAGRAGGSRGGGVEEEGRASTDTRGLRFEDNLLSGTCRDGAMGESWSNDKGGAELREVIDFVGVAKVGDRGSSPP